MIRRSAALLLVALGCTAPARRPEAALAPAAPAPAPIVRRLTVAQYRNTLTDLLGPGLVFPMLDEEPGTGGFSTTGAAQVTTSFHGVEQYVTAAEVISRQLFGDEARRYGVVGCVPSGPEDRACAGRFLTSFGRAAFRRPLTAEELDGFLAMAMATGARRGDFWAGLRVATTAILAAPSFIYAVDRGRGTPDARGRHRTTSWELAARLSFFLWNTSPDPLLLDAAARDELADDAAVRRHVLRMMASPRAREGVRNFFYELYRMDAVERVARDKEREPKVSVRAIGRTMKEETLRVLEYNVFEDRADFRKLFTSRETFINGDLAKLYRVKIVDGGFSKVVLPADGPRRGLLGQSSFLAGTSSPEKTSPTARGKWVREVLLCEAVPPPPPNVDTNLPPPEGELQTLRERLEEHRSDVGCAKCHKLIDSIGLAFERFDYYGEYREKEGTHPIDPSGALDGRAFADPAELGALLGKDDRVPACLMRNLHRYATGRLTGDEAQVKALTAAFQASGYRLYDAIVALATSDSFVYVR
jgi:hypothetical protein